MKKLLLLLCLITGIFAMTACSNTDEPKPFEYSDSDVTKTAESNFIQWNSASYADITEAQYEEYLAQYGAEIQEQIDQMKGWGKLQAELGDYKSIINTKISNNEDSITATVIAEFSNNTLLFEVTLAEDMSVTKIETDTSKYVSIQNTLKNIAMYVGIAFIVIILLAGIISILKNIAKLFNRNGSDSPSNTENANVLTASEQVNLTDDAELVAVITAAIMASMGDAAPADGLIVRSIRKVNRNKWVKA